ncbi:restriction endonuclease [Nanoarchaeota archaeon]
MVNIIKSNGDIQRYNPHKLKNSLMNAGADKNTAMKILGKVERMIYNKMTTKELFKFAFKEFRQMHPYIGLKYDLRNAIMRLGPKGFAFEKLVSMILKKKGFDVEMNRYVKGKHVTHEIDITAKKGERVLMVEAKYHNKPWIFSSIQTALYVYARFLDVQSEFTRPMIVVNTKFSRQSKQYAKGVGMYLMGWKYPEGDSLEQNIEKLGVYPITMLRCINREQTQMLLKSKVVLIETLANKTPKELVKLLRVSHKKAEKILHDSRICVGEIGVKKLLKGRKSK